MKNEIDIARLLRDAESIIDRAPSGTTDPWSADCRAFAKRVRDHLRDEGQAAHDKEQYKDWEPAEPTPHDPYGRRSV
jgi:hypothetical protein